MLSYLFKVNPSDKEIIEKLESYRRIKNEIINFTIGDYIVPKPESKLFTSCEEMYYVLDITEHVYIAMSNTLRIQTLTPCFFTKRDEQPITPMLQEFVEDKSVNKDVVSGVVVRVRKHHTLYLQNIASSYKSVTDTFTQPLLVMDNQDGNVTVVGQSEPDHFTEKTFKWYELALYY